MKRTIAIASDHAALDLKAEIKNHLEAQGFSVTDYGTYTKDSCNYPDYAEKVCNAITEGKQDLGILVCGTGIGMSMAANKINGIRAAHVTDSFSARMTKMHNNANVICLGGRITGLEIASDIVEAYLNAEFQGGRHENRVNKVMALENR